jgi:hypothetical protein
MVEHGEFVVVCVVVIVAVKDVARFLDLFFGFCRSPGHPQFRSNGQKRLFGLWG